MISSSIGVTKAGTGLEGLAWNVVGHTYRPVFHSNDAFVWSAVMPAGTFVPPHIHPFQDEWLTLLSGEMDVEIGDGKLTAGKGDTIRLPRGIAHGLFNRSGGETTAVFGVAPTGKLFELFAALDGVADPQELVRLSAAHDVQFLPSKA